jgi:hypothetical protein
MSYGSYYDSGSGNIYDSNFHDDKVIGLNDLVKVFIY